MVLTDLLSFDPIVVQCHDNPDADALASGFALYSFFKSNNKNVRFCYSGYAPITKSNLKLMCEKLSIPAEYVSKSENPFSFVSDKGSNDLLVTVDCQYGSRNVTQFSASNIAIIDHHQIENSEIEMSVILPSIGSCSTVVWQLLRGAGFDVNESENLSTALYYGLYMDTKEMSEIYNPLDRDMIDDLSFSKSDIMEFKNSNITLEELEIAGVALLRFTYNEDFRFAIIKSHPCDPNILGIISDFLLQVDKVSTCVVFTEVADGYKYSVRSCVREVNAADMAEFLAADMGSGGGHFDKAGGFISGKLYEKEYSVLNIEGYFNNRMIEYYENFEMIYSETYEADITQFELYGKKALPVGGVRLTDVVPEGTPIVIRTIEGDTNLVADATKYVLIGIKGEVWASDEQKVYNAYNKISDTFDYDACVIDKTYEPTIKNALTGESFNLSSFAQTYVSKGRVKIFAKKLEKNVKVFTEWYKDSYMVGKVGDYLAVRTDDYHDVYVIDDDVFEKTYDKE